MDRSPQHDLRSRNRVRAMAHIQRVALDLFDERGYGSVTMTEIAQAAEVGERSVYRYFGSKQGVVLYDEMDEVAIAAFGELVRSRPVLDAIRLALREADVAVDDAAMHLAVRKLRIIDSDRELRAALAELVASIGTALGDAIAAAGTAPLTARIQGRCVADALTVGIEQWFREGADGSLWTQLERAVDVLDAGFGERHSTSLSESTTR
ncbi:TetR family transcriptional regulator [Gordonia sp. Z-3]|jgi:AcrR family transcriptional regulator|uniref:TetR family transcriptional regulator n=2 Tax=Gordonia TaxID=2053 RepID=A0A9X3I5I8_9ACTN|nr:MULTISPECIES: TetR/AcrR family transcriptional regulator [Gordonia]MCF3938718.1 TetR/AcrR family transcriptional regulator [Gordonia tangerina]MCX2965306.1 TetR family transcriptional regulator [Gordonia aquimaris]MED5802360.1 TetR family transcriptional regulator [Gordonia sp. Z-3]